MGQASGGRQKKHGIYGTWYQVPPVQSCYSKFDTFDRTHVHSQEQFLDELMMTGTYIVIFYRYSGRRAKGYQPYICRAGAVPGTVPWCQVPVLIIELIHIDRAPILPIQPPCRLHMYNDDLLIFPSFKIRSSLPIYIRGYSI